MKQRLVWTPKTKDRPRTTYKGGYARTFTAKETVAAENNLRLQWKGEPVGGPIAVVLDMSEEWVDVLIQPCRAPESRHLRLGDIDNYQKLILDALNGVAWVDDRQIAELIGRKL